MLSSVLSTPSDAQIPGRQPRSGPDSAGSISSFSQVFDGLAPRAQNRGADAKSALEGGEADLLPVDDSVGLSEQPADLLADLPQGEPAAPPGSGQDLVAAPLTLEPGEAAAPAEGAIDPPPPQASRPAIPTPAEPLVPPKGDHIARTQGAAEASTPPKTPAQGDAVLPAPPDKTDTPGLATPTDSGAARMPPPDPNATTGPNATANPSAGSETAAADAAKTPLPTAAMPASAIPVAAGPETAAPAAEGAIPQANAAQGVLAASTVAAAATPKAARPVAAPAVQGAAMHEGVTRHRDTPLTAAAASGPRPPQTAQAGLRATPPQPPPEMANKPLLTDAGKPLAMVSDLLAATSRADAPPAPGVVATEPVARQIAQALQTLPTLSPGTTGRIEVVLSPAELGRVEITLTAKDAVTILSFTAERPETADLLRRNIDLLLDDLRRLGFGEAQLGFAGHRGQNSPRSPQFPTGAEVIAPAPLAPPSAAAPSGRLDLRM